MTQPSPPPPPRAGRQEALAPQMESLEAEMAFSLGAGIRFSCSAISCPSFSALGTPAAIKKGDGVGRGAVERGRLSGGRRPPPASLSLRRGGFASTLGGWPHALIVLLFKTGLEVVTRTPGKSCDTLEGSRQGQLLVAAAGDPPGVLVPQFPRPGVGGAASLRGRGSPRQARPPAPAVCRRPWCFPATPPPPTPASSSGGIPLWDLVSLCFL